MTPQQIEAMKLALEALKNNKLTHLYCEDTWYSCPKHEDGCANEAEGDECNCGADEVNAQFDKAITALEKTLAEHAMREVQRLGQEIEQEPVWSDAGNLKLLKKGDVLRVFRKGQEYYRAFRFDGLLQECDYTYDGDAPFVWLEVGMATLGKIVYTKKDFTTGAVYADRGDRVELFQPAIKEALAQPEQEPVAWATREDFYRELDRSVNRMRQQMEIKKVVMRCSDYDIALPVIDIREGHVLVGQVTTPPQRKPLTNGEIYTAYITATNQTLRAQDERLALAFARAIEAAHDIKENT